MGRYGDAQSARALPGINGTGSLLTLNNAFPYNGVMGGIIGRTFQNTLYDAHGSPPDPQTFGAVALDRAGRPLYISMGGPVANGPYDIDLTHNAAHAVRSGQRRTIPSASPSSNASSAVTIATQPRFRSAWPT